MSQSPFGDISIETFLAEYWQKKPLLVRGAYKDFVQPVDADELAGLACEEDVESRLVITAPDNDSWELKHGPFNEEMFSELPDSHWTLLVQAVDNWVPEASDLVEQFRFIPNWRYDDLMVSFASEGGGVGPHYDNYDVFLIQTQGERRWEVGGHFDQHSPRRDDTPVMIIPDWHPEQTWVLEPGDMLYVPPQVGHNGVAVTDDCMTYSVGFRAPSQAEILRGFTDYVGEQLTSESRYADPELTVQEHPGEITPQALEKVRNIFSAFLNDEQKLATWFGEYVTDPKYPELDHSPEDKIDSQQLADALAQSELAFVRNEGSRVSFTEQSNGEVLLFIDGQSYPCKGGCIQLAKLLCQTPNLIINQGKWSDDQLELLVNLYNRGSIYLAE